MRIYAFRAGKQAGYWARPISAGQIIDHCRKFIGNFSEQSDWYFEGLADGAKEFVETQLSIRPHNPAGRSVRPSHIFAHRERMEPDTVFVGALSNDEYNRLEKAAADKWLEQQAEIRRQIAIMEPLAAQIVLWESLPQKLQARCCGSSPDRCWVWRPSKNSRNTEWKYRDKEPSAPYREFYIRIKGPIPNGIILRHKCDNRLCMNPNHLEPGTASDNARDKMERGRHPAQIRERQRALRREQYRLRKERAKGKQKR